MFFKCLKAFFSRHLCAVHQSLTAALIHPSGTDYLLIHPSGTDYLLIHPSGTDYLLIHPSGTDYLLIHPSGTDYLLIHPLVTDYLLIHPLVTDYLESRQEQRSVLHVGTPTVLPLLFVLAQFGFTNFLSSYFLLLIYIVLLNAICLVCQCSPMPSLCYRIRAVEQYFVGWWVSPLQASNWPNRLAK